MEFTFEYNINGEILIPLEDTFNHIIIHNNNEDDMNDKTNCITPLSHYLTYNYTKFRSVLYENEVMRSIIGIRFTKIQGEEDEPETKIEDFIKNILIQIEFSIDFDIDSNENDNNSIEARSIVKSHEKIIAEPKELFSNSTELISRRYIDEDNKIALIEVIKPIQVPNSYLNNSILLKANLVKKTNTSFLNHIPITNITTFKTTEEFTLVKTLFKEIKIIKPFLLNQPKQLDCTPDISLFQIKLENVSSNINMIDNSLKKSQLLSEIKEKEEVNEIYFGISITIKEIQIIKDETCIDTKMVLNLNKKEQYIKKETIPLKLDSLYFIECNRDNYPITILPGEDYNIMIKLYKESALYDQLLVTLYDETIQTNNEYNKKKSLLRNSINEIFKKRTTITKYESNSNDDLILNSSSFNRINTQAMTSSSSSLSSLKTIGKGNNFSSKSTTKSKNSKRNSITSESLNEEIIKHVMSTPLFLILESNNGYYDNMFMSISMKWKNAYRNNLQVKIDINTDSCITLYNYFCVKFHFKNLSHSQMNLLVRFSESFDLIQLNKEDMNKEFVSKFNDIVGSEAIISEIKEMDIGIIKPKEKKEIIFRFIPLKIGYHYLPSIDVIDKNDTKNALKYFLYHTHKIYIQDNEDDDNNNKIDN